MGTANYLPPCNIMATSQTDDVRIKQIRPLIPPALLLEDFPLSGAAQDTVLAGRKGAEAIVRGDDDRLLVVVGPCSIHDVKAALEYSKLLKEYIDRSKDGLHIIMRVYFEKPRTTVGWKGLINDPQLNGSFAINKGLRLARGLLLELAENGLPTGCEFLDTISPQYLADLVTWGAIGARTTESQVHRELTSGLSMPVGFKNGTSGDVQIAADAIKAAKYPHSFLSVTAQGTVAIVETRGNDDCHLILRGGSKGTNYDEASVTQAVAMLNQAKVNPRVVVDCSHGNSNKLHTNQPLVADNVAAQIATGSTHVFAVMIESNIEEGNQPEPLKRPGQALKYGQSITDACIHWADTVTTLHSLARAVRQRRTL